MIDEATLNEFIEESLEHLSSIEEDLLLLEGSSVEESGEFVNKVFRAMHSIKGGAGFMGLENIKNLSHIMENILIRLRDGSLIPDEYFVSTMLNSADMLKEMIENHGESDQKDIQDAIISLKTYLEQEQEDEKKISNMTFSDKDIARFAINKEEVNSILNQYDYLYLIKFSFTNEMESSEVDAIIESCNTTGSVIDIRLDLSDETDGTKMPLDLEIELYVLFASIIDPDLMGSMDNMDSADFVTINQESFVDKLQDEEKSKVKKEFTDLPIAEKKYNKATPAKQKKVVKVQRKTIAADTSVRVNVNVLDRLMNLAGQLVLTRNQLIQAVYSKDPDKINVASRKVDIITSDLQESIMITRMQPVANVFNKFRRIVRDLSHDMGKHIILEIEGEDVELDKTIIENIADPLTHLVRNAVDHGIELPAERVNAGKLDSGTLMLRAYHEAGRVVIEITDDGKGMDADHIAQKAVEKGLLSAEEASELSSAEKLNYIFTPGFSTAQQVTQISGRGVGMDVVQTNIASLGGTIEVQTALGEGTSFKIKLPLTLAIIPALQIAAEELRFCIPQANIIELVRIPADQVKEKIEVVGESHVMRLRGQLLPLISIFDVLGMEDRFFFDKKNAEIKEERRKKIADRRSSEEKPSDDKRRSGKDRRIASVSAYNVVVVNAGEINFGLIVDKLLDSEEIVVKPLDAHLKKNTEIYAGATILGDGNIAMILDVNGVSSSMKLQKTSAATREISAQDTVKGIDIYSFLLVRNSESKQYAIPLSIIARIEKIKSSQIETVNNIPSIGYRGDTLPVFFASDLFGEIQELSEKCYTVISQIGKKEVGFIFNEIVDVMHSEVEIDNETFVSPGVMGSTVINDKATLLLDLYEMVRQKIPGWNLDTEFRGESNIMYHIVVAEDSGFFRKQMKEFLESSGFKVTAFENGRTAAEFLSSTDEHVDIVLTDIDMPEMNGFELAGYLRSNEALSLIPVIAVTSRIRAKDRTQGASAGIDAYLIKMDREQVLDYVWKYIEQGRGVEEF